MRSHLKLKPKGKGEQMWISTGNLTKFQVVVALHEYLLNNYCQIMGFNENDISKFFLETEEGRLRKIESFLAQLQPSPVDWQIHLGNHSFGINHNGRELKFCFIINLTKIDNHNIPIEERGFDSIFFDNIATSFHGLENPNLFLPQNFIGNKQNHAVLAIRQARFVIPPSLHDILATPSIPRKSTSLQSQSTESSSNGSKSPSKSPWSIPTFFSWPFGSPKQRPILVNPETPSQRWYAKSNQPQISPIKRQRFSQYKN